MKQLNKNLASLHNYEIENKITIVDFCESTISFTNIILMSGTFEFQIWNKICYSSIEQGDV